MLFPLFFPLMWVGALFILSRLGGWAQLAESYSCDDSSDAAWRACQSGMVGIVSYKGCLWVGTAPDGLYLKTGPLFLFRPFHPPLRIPWHAIQSVSQRKQLWVSTVDVRLNSGQKFTLWGGNFLEDARRFIEVDKIEH